MQGTGPPVRPGLHGTAVRIIVALVLLVIGLESLVSTLGAWLSGARPMISTGIAMPIAGLALLIDGHTALGVARWALRVQLFVTVVATGLAVAAVWPTAGLPHVVPHWRPVIAGSVHAALVIGALRWISGYRKHLPGAETAP